MLTIGKPGITGTGILSVGLGTVSGGGGGEVIQPEFLLRDDFLTDEAAPLASPRDAEPGPGTLTLVQVSGEFSISGGELTTTGQASPPTWGNLGFYSGLYARQAGRALFADFVSSGAHIGYSMAWNTAANANIPSSSGHGIQLHNSFGQARYYDGNFVPIRAYAADQRFPIALILRASGVFVVDWLAPTLLWVGVSGNSANLYATASLFSLRGTWDTFRVADLLGPWLDDYGIATDRIAGSVNAGATFSHEANCLAEWTQTTLPSSDYTDVWLRRIDADSGIVVSTASDGTIELFEASDGNWTLLGASPGVVANGHRLVVVCDGTIIGVYSNNTLQITGSSSVGQSATSGRLDALGTGGAVSNVVSWPRVISGIAKQWLDAAIAD